MSHFRSEQVVVLAGGQATRLGPLAHSVPKSLQSIGSRPFLDIMLAPLQACGFRRFHFCLGHLAAGIHQYLAATDSALEITTSVEQEPRGTAGALLACVDYLDDLFLLVLGDTYLDIDYGAVVDALPADALGLIVATRAFCGVQPNITRSGGRVERYEKRGISGGLTDTGVAVLRKSALTALAPDCGHSDLGDLFHALMAQRKLACIEIGEHFHDIGTPGRLREFAAGPAQAESGRDQTP